jgi:hypothetical protein
VSERVASIEAAAEAFRTLAAAEGHDIPMYARLCDAIAADPEAAGLLLEAPSAQRLPVLVLAALHDVVLEHSDAPLGAWYPSVGGDPDLDGDLPAALHETLDVNRPQILDSVRHRRVQTNEVNRCVGWRAALATACRHDDRPLALVEVGASAGLNLWLDRYRVDFDGGAPAPVGPPDAPVRLSTEVRTGPWSGIEVDLPPVVARVGIDQHPLDPTDPSDARWLTACVWPEQTRRLERLRAALDLAAADPAPVTRGDMVDDVAAVIESLPPRVHVVVLSSWALAYVDRAQRSAFLDHLGAAAAQVARGGGRLTLATLEADRILPWVVAPPLPADAPASLRHASLLATTSFNDGGAPGAEVLARCQAHLAWMERLS